MWAGGELEFLQQLQTARPVEQRSTLTDLQRKRGRSGELVFIRLQHEYHQADTLCIRERQDIVFRQAQNAARPASDAQTPAERSPLQTVLSKARFSKKLVADPTLLFRYSAATFNAHRIHYDRDYATRVEGYPALVVHGPLLATVLLDMLNQQGKARVTRFSFRAEHPVFDGQPIHFTAHPVEAGGNSADQAQWQLAVYNDHGQRCMQAQASTSGSWQ
jgi:3-methylfumaryl-CoA hydratase